MKPANDTLATANAVVDKAIASSSPEVFRKLRKLSTVIFTYPKKRYLAYIRSPQWAKRRREHIAWAVKCQVCLWRPPVQVHHWSYMRLGHEMPEDLCAVCVDCHHKLHCITLPTPANDNQLKLPLTG